MKMSASRWILGLGLGGLLAGGCAGLSGGGNTEGAVQRNVGLATQYDLEERVARVLQRNQFVVEREELESIFYIESRWRDRAPFEDERESGVRAAQSRMIVRGTPRSATGTQGQMYNVTVTIETRVSVLGGSDWRRDVATPQFREYALDITEDLRRELEIGVRRFGPDTPPPDSVMTLGF